MRVGVEGAYPPFSWKEADGTLKGFDIEFAQAVCKHVHKTCVLVEQEWDGMIPALLSKKFDTIIASMSITAERKKKIDFTIKYYNTPAMLVAKENPGFDGTGADLAGKRVGVQRATTHQCYAEKFFPDAELVLYGTQEEVFQDLAVGRLDAQLSDSLQALEGFLSKDAGKGFAFLGGAQDDLECMGEGAGFCGAQGRHGATRYVERGHHGAAGGRDLQDPERQVLRRRHLRQVTVRVWSHSKAWAGSLRTRPRQLRWIPSGNIAGCCWKVQWSLGKSPTPIRR